MKILLAITFVYGVVRLLSHTKLFDSKIVGALESIIPTNSKKGVPILMALLDIWFFYFSLIFQAWYWIFR